MDRASHAPDLTKMFCRLRHLAVLDEGAVNADRVTSVEKAIRRFAKRKTDVVGKSRLNSGEQSACKRLFVAAQALLAELFKVKDGKSLIEHSQASNSVGHCNTKDCRLQHLTNQLEASADFSETLSARIMYHGDLGAPAWERMHARSTTARERLPYEMADNRSRFCTFCRGKRHKSTTCPQTGDLPEAMCSNCGVSGYPNDSCGKPLLSIILVVQPAGM